MSGEEKIWATCFGCGDFLCTIHNEHVADCSCPSIDVWATTEWNPYDDVPTPAIRKWAEANKWDEDD